MPKIKRVTETPVFEDNRAPTTVEAWCTCGTSGKYGFDQQLGVFVHRGLPGAGEGCYKPSKEYYKHAVEAGIILP